MLAVSLFCICLKLTKVVWMLMETLALRIYWCRLCVFWFRENQKVATDESLFGYCWPTQLLSHICVWDLALGFLDAKFNILCFIPSSTWASIYYCYYFSRSFFHLGDLWPIFFFFNWCYLIVSMGVSHVCNISI